MSLSSHLRSKSRSPVWRWLRENFPHTRSVAAVANKELRGASKTCLVPAPAGSDAGLVGTGVDFLLRACLRASSIESTAATKSARSVGVPGPQSHETAIAIEREVAKRIQELKPDSRQLDDAQWRELSALCLVLARFEQNYRAVGPPSPAISEHLLEPLRKCQSLDELLPLAVNEPSIDDLAHLGRVAWEDHQELRDAQPLFLNPEFALSPALGGADADLIVRDELLDWKTNTGSAVGWEALYQLIGYALADTEDQYGIREVGIIALRWRNTKTWPLTDLLTELSFGRNTHYKVVKGQIFELQPVELEPLRQEFAQVVNSTPRAQRLAKRAAKRKNGSSS